MPAGGAAAAGALRRHVFTHEHFFDPEEGHGVFPPRSVEWHSVQDYVDLEGETTPGQGHPYG